MENRTCKKCGDTKPLDEIVFNATFKRYTNECKACKVAYLQKYRQENRERLVAFDKARHAANPEYRREQAKQWAKDNPERHRKLTKKWADNNRDKQRAAIAAWEKANPSKVKAIKMKRRARVMGAEGQFSAEEWDQLKLQTGNVCLSCGAPESEKTLTADHVIPLASGGSNRIDNIQPLCKVCNSTKGTRTFDYRYAETEAA